MKTWIQRSLFGVSGILGLFAATVACALLLGTRKLERQIEVAVAPFAVSGDAAAVLRGRYLYVSRGCAGCHGNEGRGGTVVDDGAMVVRAPDITSAGAIRRYSGVDWVRTIRHGVKPNGRPVLIMPSEEYARWTDVDLSAVAAYLEGLPPGPGTPTVIHLPAIVKALYAFGIFKDASEKIDHGLPASPAVPEAITEAHGAYVANACIGCHGAGLDGGKIPGAPPDWPAAARLRGGRDSALNRYPTPESFEAMFKTGKRPDGSSISKVMPFGSLKEMNETDVRALYLHLQSLSG